jgi:Winged helix DNA-binding domain
MAGKGSFEATPLKQLQRYHHTTLNTFGDGETLVEAIHRRPGIYGPNPIAYLSLLARRSTLTLGDMDEALVNDRSLVRSTAFRGSLYLIASEDYPLYFRALYDILSTTGMTRLRSEGIDEAQLKMYAERLRDEDFDMPKQESELVSLLFPGKERRPGVDIERLLLRKLCDIGVLVRTTSKGWKGNQWNYALTEHWLGVELEPEQVEQAKVETVRRYLRAYGPARMEDAAWWTGLPLADVRRVFETLGREVVRLPVDGLGDGLVTLREVADQTKKGGGTPERILFLPLWDAYPLGWRDRTRVVEPRFAPWVYDPAGNTTSIIVEEGRCIGLWQFRDGDSITIEFHIFEPYANRLNAVRLAAETHAGQLAVVAGARDVRVIERALPQALAERPAASFLWPLGKEPVFRLSDSDYDNPMDRRERQPNVLRSKFLDDERLVRPVEELSERPRSIGLGEKKPLLKADAHKPAPVSQGLSTAVKASATKLDAAPTKGAAVAVTAGDKPKKTVHVAPSKKKAQKPAAQKPAATRGKKPAAPAKKAKRK